MLVLIKIAFLVPRSLLFMVNLLALDVRTRFILAFAAWDGRQQRIAA